MFPLSTEDTLREEASLCHHLYPEHLEMDNCLLQESEWRAVGQAFLHANLYSTACSHRAAAECEGAHVCSIHISKPPSLLTICISVSQQLMSKSIYIALYVSYYNNILYILLYYFVLCLSPTKNLTFGRLGYILVVDHLPRAWKAPGSIPNTKQS